MHTKFYIRPPPQLPLLITCFQGKRAAMITNCKEEIDSRGHLVRNTTDRQCNVQRILENIERRQSRETYQHPLKKNGSLGASAKGAIGMSSTCF